MSNAQETPENFSTKPEPNQAWDVPCRYCHAKAGEPCMNLAFKPPRPVTRFPAHQCRINDSIPF